MVVLKHSDEIVDRRGGFVHRYTVGELAKKKASDEVHRMVKLYLRDHPEADYGTVMRRVLDTHPQLKKTYAGHWG